MPISPLSNQAFKGFAPGRLFSLAPIKPEFRMASNGEVAPHARGGPCREESFGTKPRFEAISFSLRDPSTPPNLAFRGQIFADLISPSPNLQTYLLSPLPYSYHIEAGFKAIYFPQRTTDPAHWRRDDSRTYKRW
jgi:hypothetical protein